MAEEEAQNPSESHEKDDDAKEEGKSMTPWEQHAAVINLPRYDYNAPSSFLRRSQSGFLITCPIKREKSATKEGISFLQEHIKKIMESACDATKKRKISPENSETLLSVKNKEKDNKCINSDEETERIDSNENIKQNLNITLVKLTRSGLVLLSFKDNIFHDKVTKILSDIFASLKSQKLKSPRWCNRIFPIQETCLLSENELNSIVLKLFNEYFCNIKSKLDDQPIKFAVGYNRRSNEESNENKTEINKLNNNSGLMEREKCFDIVASAINSIAKNSIVDLKSPQVVVLVELLPILGLPNGSQIVGVSVLPFGLISTKPRLSIKSLLSK